MKCIFCRVYRFLRARLLRAATACIAAVAAIGVLAALIRLAINLQLYGVHWYSIPAHIFNWLTGFQANWIVYVEGSYRVFSVLLLAIIAYTLVSRKKTE